MVFFLHFQLKGRTDGRSVVSRDRTIKIAYAVEWLFTLKAPSIMSEFARFRIRRKKNGLPKTFTVWRDFPEVGVRTHKLCLLTKGREASLGRTFAWCSICPGKDLSEKILYEVRRCWRMKFLQWTMFQWAMLLLFFSSFCKLGSTREFSNDKSDSKDTVVLKCVKTHLKKIKVITGKILIYLYIIEYFIYIYIPWVLKVKAGDMAWGKGEKVFKPRQQHLQRLQVKISVGSQGQTCKSQECPLTMCSGRM